MPKQLTHHADDRKTVPSRRVASAVSCEVETQKRDRCTSIRSGTCTPRTTICASSQFFVKLSTPWFPTGVLPVMRDNGGWRRLELQFLPPRVGDGKTF